jgi:hypothetical protein
MHSASFVRNLCCYATLGVPLSWSAASIAETAPISSQAEPTPEETASTEAASSPSSQAQSTAREATCRPSCRSGYTCIAGRCVSACNPPCDAGEVCTKAGQCEAKPVAEKKVEVVPEAPRTHMRNPAMLVGGMVLSSVGAFVGLLGYSTISRDRFRCDHGQSASCSTSKGSVALVVSGLTMLTVGVPFILVGAWRVPNTPPASRISHSRTEGTTLWLGPTGLSLCGTF